MPVLSYVLRVDDAMIGILATLSKISSLIVMSMANTGSISFPLSCVTDPDPRHPLQDILPCRHEHGKQSGILCFIGIFATLSKISSLVVMSMANTGSKSSPLSCVTDPDPRHPLQDILPCRHEHGKHRFKIISINMCCGSGFGIPATLSKISSLVVMSMANTGSKSSPLTLRIRIRDPVLYCDPRLPFQDILPCRHEHGKHRFKVLSIMMCNGSGSSPPSPRYPPLSS